MWDLIVSVPDHCLSFYFALPGIFVFNFLQANSGLASIVRKENADA